MAYWRPCYASFSKFSHALSSISCLQYQSQHNHHDFLPLSLASVMVYWINLHHNLKFSPPDMSILQVWCMVFFGLGMVFCKFIVDLLLLPKYNVHMIWTHLTYHTLSLIRSSLCHGMDRGGVSGDILHNQSVYMWIRCAVLLPHPNRTRTDK